MSTAPARPSEHEKIPDLSKGSEVYREHEPAIEEIRAMLADKMALMTDILRTGQDRMGRGKVNLPPIRAIDNPTHINCDGLQILFHGMGMEAFRANHPHPEAYQLREPLQHIASVRISVMQYDTNLRAMSYVGEIQAIDRDIAALAPHAEVPALTPYLFRPHTAISQLKKLAVGRKFENPDLLMNMGVLYAGDNHILHAVCMSMLENKMADSVVDVLKTRAMEVFPEVGDDRALLPFLSRAGLDLFTVYVIALTESGNTAEAIKTCNMAMWAPKVRASEKLTVKLAASLRNQGRFDEALRLLTDAREVHNLKSSNLNTEYQLALRKDRTVQM